MNRTLEEKKNLEKLRPVPEFSDPVKQLEEIKRRQGRTNELKEKRTAEKEELKEKRLNEKENERERRTKGSA